MAYNTAAFNPKEWQVGIAEETTVGTAVTTVIEIEVDDAVKYPTIGDLRIREQRSGSLGRVLNTGDLYEHTPGAVTEVTISGVLTTANILPLVQNALGVAASTAPVDVSISEKHAPAHFLQGAAASGAENTLTVVFQGVASPNSSYTMKGCVIDNLKLIADSNEDGGRFTFEATLKTRDVFSSTASAAATYTITPFTRNYLYLSDFTEQKIVMEDEVILDAFEFLVENPVTFLGNKVVGGDYGLPEAYERSMPNLNVMATCTVKFDANTSDWIQKHRVGTVSTGGATPANTALYLANNATWASATAIGFNMPFGIIETAEYEDGDYQKIKAEIKMVDPATGSTELLNVIVT
jgi:hypothetical protein